MDTITNSTGYYQDNLGPLAGVDSPCKEEFNYPTHFPDFHWWRPQEKTRIGVILRDEVPIPPLRNKYPYRFSSAAPCSVGRTKKEWDIYRCLLQSMPKEDPTDKVDPQRIAQARGYETTSMDASLLPFRSKVDVTQFKAAHISRGSLEPTWIPYRAHSEFDQYIMDMLYPAAKNDILYKRRILFRMKFTDFDELSAGYNS